MDYSQYEMSDLRAMIDVREKALQRTKSSFQLSGVHRREAIVSCRGKLSDLRNEIIRANGVLGKGGDNENR